MPSINFPAWPDRIVIDESAPCAVAKELDKRHAERVFLVMSATLSRNADLTRGLRAALGEKIVVYTGVRQHSPLPDVLAASRAAKAAGPEVLVSLGGGSVIDATKIIQYCLAADIVDEAEFDKLATGQSLKTVAKHASLAHICVPTTLSGAEFTYFAGARNPVTGRKQGFVDPELIPRTIIFDAALTKLTPRTLWLSSGIRAMDHAVEGICSARCHPFAQVLAERGIAQLASGLKGNLVATDDLVSRGESQFAAWYASVPLSSGVTMGASHAIGHALGGIFDVPHGLTSCVVLPAVMEFNFDTVPGRLGLVARALGGRHGRDAPDLVRRIIAELGLPTRLSDIGLHEDVFPKIAEATMCEGWIKTNPRPIEDKKDVIQILRLAA
jgi:maleylacetate reductase